MEHEHEHRPLPGLLDHVNATWVGGPLKVLAPAAAAAQGLPGLGPLVSLIQFGPPIGAKHDPQKLGRTPLVMTASVFGQGGTGPIVGIARWGSGNGYQQSLEFDIELGFPQATFGGIPPGSTVGGQLFSLPGTSFEIAARNDLNFVPSAGSIALGAVLAPPVPSQASASLGTGNRASGGLGLTRTVYGYFNPAVPLVGTATIPVPAFAKRFRVFRSTGVVAAAAITVLVTDGNFVIIDGSYNEAAGAPPAIYHLPSAASTVQVTCAGPGCTVVGAIFELGL